MSILSGPEIAKIIRRTRTDLADGSPLMLPAINVTPFNPENVGPNSIDVTLGNKLLCYEPLQFDTFTGEPRNWLDSKQPNKTYEIDIPEAGLVIRPKMLYLGSTVEKTMTAGVVPWVDGRSSVGRLGIQIHMTAGRGDDGFGEELAEGCSWTLEITCVMPVKIYAGMRIGQITFMHLVGERNPYRGRYGKQIEPTASLMHEKTKEPK